MMMEGKKFFTAPELYLLASAFDGKDLFGLPEKQLYQLMGDEVFEEAQQRLIEKKILTSEGKITESGAVIIQVIESYYQSEKYVRINNLMFSFQRKNDEEVILLVELEDGQYQLQMISKVLVLKNLSDQFPIILREPLERETTFLKEEVSNKERRELETFELEDMFMNLELFHLNEKPKDQFNPKYYQQWLVFTNGGKLIMVDTVNKKYYHASQYWFLKVLFDELDFPYKEEDVYA